MPLNIRALLEVKAAGMHIGLCHKDIRSLTRGGICTLFKNLALHLAELGVKVTLISSAADWSPWPLRVIRIPYEGNKWHYAEQVAEVVRFLDLDIVECSTWGFELLSYLRRPQRQTRVVIRGDLSARTMGAERYASGEEELLKRADYRIAVSQFAKHDLAHSYKGVRIDQVIPNGVDTSVFYPQSSESVFPISGTRVFLKEGVIVAREPLSRSNGGILRVPASDINYIPILWVGKATVMKGFDHLQSIVDMAPSEFIFYLVLGHAPVQVPIRIGDRPNVYFLQDLSISDLALLYRRAAVFLFPSRWEGFGLAALEAMACGTPVVFLQSCEALQDLVGNGKGGLAFRNPNEAITRILEATSQPELALQAQARARRFNWRRNAQLTLKAYQEICQQ